LEKQKDLLTIIYALTTVKAWVLNKLTFITSW
jgi:hypothetical protein